MAAKFQISDFKTVEDNGEVFSPDNHGVQVDSHDGHLGRPNHSVPQLQHPTSIQTTNSTNWTIPQPAEQRKIAGAQNQKVRPCSDSRTSDAAMLDEAIGIRGRSQSAPPILWAAMRYGRDLRRMSDEFDSTYQFIPRPKSAGHASELMKGTSWTKFFQNIFGHGRRKEDPSKPKEF